MIKRRIYKQGNSLVVGIPINYVTGISAEEGCELTFHQTNTNTLLLEHKAEECTNCIRKAIDKTQRKLFS